jgi:hypothetical protein
MSLNRQEIIDCSRCQHRQQFTVWESVNVSVDPSLKQALLKGDLTTFRCSRCRNESTVAFNCLYHDMDRSLAIWLKHLESGEDGDIDPVAKELFSNFAKDYKCRVVNSFHELVDKIRIFDDGFSDHEIELIKLLICLREGIDISRPFHYAEVTSSWFKGKWFAFAVEDSGGFVERSVPVTKTLDAVRPILARIQLLIDGDSGGWAHVNRMTLLGLLEKSGFLQELVPQPHSGETIKVHSIGRPPPINDRLNLDEWVFSGARTYKVENWQIGKEISAKDAEKWRDPQTGEIYVFHQIVDGEWKVFFITREKFNLIKAVEERV